MSTIFDTASKRVQDAIQSEVIKVTETKNGLYKIWKYDKNMVTDDDIELGLYRSLVFSTRDSLSNVHDVLVSYAPEKSLSKSNIINEIKRHGSEYYVTETIEGTMVNLFYNHFNNDWEIATRSGVGGRYWYNRTNYGNEKKQQKTFRDMFIECLGGKPEDGIYQNTIPGLEYLSKNYCYCFVIQHPDNHFVYRIRQPTAHLVSIYDLRSNGYQLDSTHHSVQWINYDTVCEESGQLLYSKVAAELGCMFVNIATNLNGLVDKFLQTEEINESEWFNNPYPMGYMIVNKRTGHRYSIENEQYKQIKELRGNNPNLQYQYLSLNRANKVIEFLSYFPQYKKQFYAFYKQYHEFITEVHNAYVNYYILKQRDQIPKKYFIHVSKIHHNIYLPSLNNGSKQVITHRIVREYFDSLSPSSQIYYLNLVEEPIEN